MSRTPAWLLGAVVAAAPLGAAETPKGTVVGWVEDSQGSPIPGALVSLFGKGVRGSGIVTFTDNAGRFSLSSLPPGSYTLRALLGTDVAATAREITVLPSRRSVFTLSLEPTPEAEADEAELVASSDRPARELRWLLRHKERSVLEEREHSAGDEQQAGPAPVDVARGVSALFDEMNGTLELVTSPRALASESDPGGVPTSLGLLRLAGRFGDAGTWNLGGLLAESASNSWRVAGEFIIEPDPDHRIEAGSGYGSYELFARPGPDEAEVWEQHSVGALFVQDRWSVTPRVAVSAGARYSYVGFLQQANHVDPTVSAEFRGPNGIAVAARASSSTLAPGGDLLRLSSFGSDPVLSYATFLPDLRAERIRHYEFSVRHEQGRGALTVRAFREDVEDPLVHAYGRSGALHVLNDAARQVEGVGLGIRGEFATGVQGSLDYTYGRTAGGSSATPHSVVLAFPEGAFHDIVARLTGAIARSDSRLTVYYRLNALRSEDETGDGFRTIRRFDVQFSQGLPFIGGLARADVDLLLGLRNAFYELDEGGTLDELAVLDPPTRVVGGISVRF